MLSALRNKNATLLLLAGSALLCLLSLVLFDREHLLSVYRQLGFYMLFGTAIYWLYVLLPDQLPTREQLSCRWHNQGILLLAVLLTGLMFLVSPLQFRILADETNLVSVSYSMFANHSFANLTESLYYFRQHQPLSSNLDIRPNVFPFLMYLVHVVRGYSAYNGFIVNFFAGVASLWLMFWLLHRWFHWHIALLGMLLLAAFPVYVLWVTASGFEIVNLSLALLSFCLLYQYLAQRTTRSLERLLLTLVLLAQTRYESAVLVMAIGIVLLLSLRSGYLESLALRLAVIPWLFLPVAWHRLIKADKSDYQVYGDDQIFSVGNLLNNLPAAWDYFTADQVWYGTISAAFYLALAGVVVGASSLVLNRSRMVPSLGYLLLAAALGLMGLVAVVFSYYWGNLTFVFTLRLGIIFLPFIVVAVCYLASTVGNRLWREWPPAARGKLSALLGLSLLLLFWPVAWKNEAVSQLTLNRLYQHSLSFLQREYPGHDNLIITDRPGMYSVHQWGAVSGEYAQRNHQGILEGARRRLYQNVLVIQEISYATGLPEPATAIPSQLMLEPVFETQFDAEKLLRISRVVIDGEKQEP